MRVLMAMLCIVTSSSCLFSDEDGDGTNYVAVNEIDVAYKDAQCTHLAMCGLFPNKAACLTAELTSPSFEIDPNVEAAIYGGHIIYNGSKVKACIDSFAARSCDKTDKAARTVPPECSGFFRGTLMAGASCYVDEECISQRCSGAGGQTCSIGSCIGDTPPATEPLAIGETCFATTGTCVEGAYCDQSTDLCAALKASGTACSLDGECDYGLACKGATGARVCGALPAIGQPCGAGNENCRDEGAYCDFTNSMCKQLGVEGSCDPPRECSPYYPCTLDQNGTNATCLQGPSVGESCSSGGCFDAGTYCDFTTNTCVARKAVGAACGSATECATNLCDFNASTPVCAEAMTCF